MDRTVNLRKRLLKPAFVTAALLLLSPLMLTACGDDGQNTAPAQDAQSPNNANLVYANGWDRIEVVANFAKTTIYNTGHFDTSRNACGYPQDGVLDVALWNRLATLMNQALSQPMLSENKCLTPPDGAKMDGTADLIADNRKITIFEPNGYDSCSKFSDPEVTRQLYDAIDQVVKIADKEACPNGWGF